MMSAVRLMIAYIVIAFAFQAVSLTIGMMTESLLAGWSMPIFLTVYLAAFWLAWPLAVRLTEPSATAAEGVEAAKAA